MNTRLPTLFFATIALAILCYCQVDGAEGAQAVAKHQPPSSFDAGHHGKKLEGNPSKVIAGPTRLLTKGNQHVQQEKPAGKLHAGHSKSSKGGNSKRRTTGKQKQKQGPLAGHKKSDKMPKFTGKMQQKGPHHHGTSKAKMESQKQNGPIINLICNILRIFGLQNFLFLSGFCNGGAPSTTTVVTKGATTASTRGSSAAILTSTVHPPLTTPSVRPTSTMTLSSVTSSVEQSTTTPVNSIGPTISTPATTSKSTTQSTYDSSSTRAVTTDGTTATIHSGTSSTTGPTSTTGTTSTTETTSTNGATSTTETTSTTGTSSTDGTTSTTESASTTELTSSTTEPPTTALAGDPFETADGEVLTLDCVKGSSAITILSASYGSAGCPPQDVKTFFTSKLSTSSYRLVVKPSSEAIGGFCPSTNNTLTGRYECSPGTGSNSIVVMYDAPYSFSCPAGNTITFRDASYLMQDSVCYMSAPPPGCDGQQSCSGIVNNTNILGSTPNDCTGPGNAYMYLYVFYDCI